MDQYRTSFQEMLEGLFDKGQAPFVAYNPPSSTKLKYPCILYKLIDMPSTHADNSPYRVSHMYEVTVIDPDPNSELRERVSRLPTANLVRPFVSDNLNHYIFRLYY